MPCLSKQCPPLRNRADQAKVSYGISTLSPKFFGGPPDLAVLGPNVGRSYCRRPFSQSTGSIAYSKHRRPSPFFWDDWCSRCSYQPRDPGDRVPRSKWLPNSVGCLARTPLLRVIRTIRSQHHRNPGRNRKALLACGYLAQCQFSVCRIGEMRRLQKRQVRLEPDISCYPVR